MAISYVVAIEAPQNFRDPRSVGALFGLTARCYQSGEVDVGGRISLREDTRLRGLLYEAATAILTKTSAKTESQLKIWGLQLHKRLGFKRAAVAVARKLAVFMHTMLPTYANNSSVEKPRQRPTFGSRYYHRARWRDPCFVPFRA